METTQEIPQFIDIKKVIASKNPKLLKWTPRFLLNYVKRVIHQDEINYVIHTYGKNKEGLPFVHAVITQHWRASYSVFGLDEVPQDGRYIFASNHPLGAFDGLILLDVVGARFPHVKFIVNDLLLNVGPLQPVFVPVNKHGRQSVDYARRMDETYSSPSVQVLYFPAGLCSRRYHGVISDPPWKKSFIQKAVQSKRDVVPVFFDGRNSNFFYNLSSIRRKLGIKANIEMFYLPDEFFKQKNTHYNVHFGRAIPWQTFDKSRTMDEWTSYVREKVYTMSNFKK